MDTLTTALAAVSFTSDDVTFSTAATLEIISPQYYRNPVQRQLATVGFHCYNGVLDQKSGMNY